MAKKEDADMDNSILFARFIGPFIMVVGAGILLNMKTFKKIGEDFFKNAGMVLSLIHI